MSTGTPRVSMVVVGYEMARELPRTVQSLSPPVQRGVDTADYELIVVDNGSGDPVDREACEAFGASIRWIDVEGATPSPAPAANLGIAAARAPLVGMMIDGARMASPGLIAAALDAAALHERPVVATLAYHLGDRPQLEATAAGYDRAEEDAMLAAAGWTEDGYRLFDISVLAPSSSAGSAQLPWETNALFMSAAMWEELAGFDERFRAPGGGLVNLDTFARACALPGAQVMLLLGEATFHQVHGGISTNVPVNRQDDWHNEYMRIRGRALERPDADAIRLGRVPTRARPGAAAMRG